LTGCGWANTAKAAKGETSAPTPSSRSSSVLYLDISPYNPPPNPNCPILNFQPLFLHEPYNKKLTNNWLNIKPDEFVLFLKLVGPDIMIWT
jgi:hypothetical protein